MVFAGVFVGLGVMAVSFLYLCWERYWRSVRRARGFAEFFSRPCLSHSDDLRPLYILQEEFLDQKEAWNTRYHWCLLLGPVFFSLAAFCAVLNWTWEWPFLPHLLLSILGGLTTLLGVGYIGYGVVREKILPL